MIFDSPDGIHLRQTSMHISLRPPGRFTMISTLHLIRTAQFDRTMLETTLKTQGYDTFTDFQLGNTLHEP